MFSGFDRRTQMLRAKMRCCGQQDHVRFFNDTQIVVEPGVTCVIRNCHARRGALFVVGPCQRTTRSFSGIFKNVSDGDKFRTGISIQCLFCRSDTSTTATDKPNLQQIAACCESTGMDRLGNGSQRGSTCGGCRQKNASG